MKTSSPLARINVELVPPIIKLPNGVIRDPATADSCDFAASPPSRTQSSPVFTAQPLAWGGIPIGTGQYAGAFQCAGFWRYARPGGINPAFGIQLAGKTLKAVTITVPSATSRPPPSAAATACSGGCQPLLAGPVPVRT